MHLSFQSIVAILIAAATYGGTASAQIDGQTRFDLICPTVGHDSQPPAQTRHFHIDLSMNEFCTEKYCANFTRNDRSSLEYHCSTKPGGHFCPPLPKSRKGPFVHSLDITIDRLTGSFHEKVTGTVCNGDWGGWCIPIDGSRSGRCSILPFTSLPG